jgi:hypothetical protein
MNEIVQQLKSLRKQLDNSLNDHKRLKSELASLKLIHQQLEVEKLQLLTDTTDLKEQLKTIKLAQALAGSGDQDTRALKLQINGYLREIDKCLALLNRDPS